MYAATRLRSARERVVADITLRGPGFGAALADACDEAIVESAAALAVKGQWAVIALGSYARRELCPGSDLDVVLVVDRGPHTLDDTVTSAIRTAAFTALRDAPTGRVTVRMLPTGRPAVASVSISVDNDDHASHLQEIDHTGYIHQRL